MTTRTTVSDPATGLITAGAPPWLAFAGTWGEDQYVHFPDVDPLRYVAGPLQAMTDGRLDAAILRQLMIALAMIGIMLARPRGLWPSPEHGKAAPSPAAAAK